MGEVWGVYDLHRYSWPVQLQGGVHVKQFMTTPAEAQAEADRLNRLEAS